jgi:hypothetical protein
VLLPLCFELTVTSVRRPITAEGLITNTLPLPLEVLIPATATPAHCPDCGVHVLLPRASIVQLDWQVYPPEMVPPEFRVHATGLVPFPVVEYEKFPLLCANAVTDAAINAADLKAFFILLLLRNLCFACHWLQGQASEPQKAHNFPPRGSD